MMKKVLFLLAIGIFLITGCTGVKTATKGLENQAYLEFLGDPSKYENGINVNIDESTTFKAIVNKANSTKPKGNVYAISTGNHIVKVTYNSNLLYSKQIFVGAQETKQIILP